MIKEENILFDLSLNKRNDFKNEKELKFYIENNKELFTEAIGLGKLVSFEKEKSINKTRFGKYSQRLDFYIKGTKYKAIVEVKSPNNYFCEMRNAIAQILYYGSLAQRKGFNFDKLIIVSSVIDNNLFNMILDYKLPIELFLLTREYNGFITIK